MALKNKTQEKNEASGVKQSPQVERTSNEHEHPVNPAHALKRVASGRPATLRPPDVLALQRAVGNRAVQRILASQQPSLPAQSSNPANAIQRKTEEEELLQGKF